MPLFKYDVSSIGQLECLDRNSNAFQHLWNKFGLQKSEAKIKEGVFVAMNWCLTMSSTGNWSRLNQQQWEPFMQVVQNILGNHKDAEVVDNLLEAYQLMSARILLKMHFLHSYIDFFLGEEWGNVSPRYKNVANEKKKSFEHYGCLPLVLAKRDGCVEQLQKQMPWRFLSTLTLFYF